MTGDTENPEASPSTTTHQPLARPSTVFERPPGNVFTVPDDGGSALEDVSERPTILAPVEVTGTTG